MRMKILGRTNLNVSIVGLGTAFLGMRRVDAQTGAYEALARTVDEDLGVATVHAALEAGCTLIDTAPLYGAARSEAMIGRALAARPDLAGGVVVTTKVGRTIDGYDYSADAVRRSIEASLARLGMDRLAVVYIHDPMGADPSQVLHRNGALGGLRRLQQQGIVGYAGVAADDPHTNADYIETGEFDAAVVPRGWSLINRHAEQRIFPEAERHNVGLVLATSLERGLLATGPRPGATYFDRNYSAECQAHVAKIQGLCRAHGVPLLAAALQWVTRHPRIATNIPGARFPAEAAANARAAMHPIPESFWIELTPLVIHWEDAVRRV